MYTVHGRVYVVYVHARVGCENSTRIRVQLRPAVTITAAIVLLFFINTIKTYRVFV